MARLPDSTAFGQRPTPRAPTDVVESRSGDVARAMSDLGRTLGEIGEDIGRKEDEQAVFEARRKLDEWERKTVYDPTNGVVAKRGVDALNLPGQVAKDFDAFAGEVGGTLSTNRQRKIFQDMAQSRRNQVADFTIRHATQQKEVYEQGQFKADIDASEDRAKLLTLNGDFVGAFMEQGVASGRIASFMKTRGASDEQVKQAVTDQARKTNEAAYLSYFDTKATKAYVDGDVASLKEVKVKLDGPIGENLDPMKRAALSRQFHAWQESIVASDRYRVASKIQDYKSAVLNGEGDRIPLDMIPTREEVKALHPKGEDAAIFYRNEVEPYVKIQAGVQAMKSASYDDRQKMVADVQPGEVAPGYAGDLHMRDALFQAKKLVEKQIADDPAAYALKNSPRVASAQWRMTKVLSDPSMPMEDRVAVVDFYARTTEAEQLRLGVGSIRDELAGNKQRSPRLLTNEQANNIADQFNDQKNGGERAAVLVDSLEKQYGKWWPQVFTQLAADNKLPPSALVIPNMADLGARSRLAVASATKPEVLKEQLSSTDPKDIRDNLLSQFGDARGSFSAQGMGGSRTMSIFMDQAEKLAMLYRTQGKSAGDSAKQAYEEVMGHRYEFLATYRVPKTEAPQDVQLGARAVLASLDGSGIQPMRAEGVPAKPGELGEMTLDAIKANGQWITDSEEKGLRLMVQGKEGALYSVRDTFGEPISYTWIQLRETGAKYLSDRNAAIQEKAGGRVPALGGITEAQRSKMLHEVAEQDRQRRLREAGAR